MCFLSISEHRLLSALLDDAVALVHELKLLRHPMDLLDHNAFARKLKVFQVRVEAKKAQLGSARVLRILRLDVPAVRGIDRNMATNPNLENGILWAEGVFKNIDNEIRRIDSNRILWLTFFAAVASVLAAFTAIYAVLFKG